MNNKYTLTYRVAAGSDQSFKQQHTSRHVHELVKTIGILSCSSSGKKRPQLRSDERTRLVGATDQNSIIAFNQSSLPGCNQNHRLIDWSVATGHVRGDPPGCQKVANFTSAARSSGDFNVYQKRTNANNINHPLRRLHACVFQNVSWHASSECGLLPKHRNPHVG